MSGVKVLEKMTYQKLLNHTANLIMLICSTGRCCRLWCVTEAIADKFVSILGGDIHYF